MIPIIASAFGPAAATGPGELVGGEPAEVDAATAPSEPAADDSAADADPTAAGTPAEAAAAGDSGPPASVDASSGSPAPQPERATKAIEPIDPAAPVPSAPATEPDHDPEGRGGYALRLGDGYRLRIGGQYRVMASAASFGWHAQRPSEPSVVLNQRLRTWLNLHGADESHGAVVQVEAGHIAFGRDGDYPKTYGDDRIGIELRRGFLFVAPSPALSLKVGIQAWHDRFGEAPSFDGHLFAVDAYDSFGALLANSVWDFNVGGISAEGAVGPSAGTHYRAGAFVVNATEPNLVREGATVLTALDLDQELGEHLVGVSAYAVYDDGAYSLPAFADRVEASRYRWAFDGWLGARAHLRFDRVAPSFAVIYNGGTTSARAFVHHGAAAKVAVAIPTERAGELRLQAVGASGGSGGAHSSEFRTIAQSEGDDLGAQGYWSYLALSSPRGSSDIADLGIGVQNRGEGLLTAQVAWSKAVLRDKLGLYAALGWLAPATARTARGHGAEELVVELTWNLYRRLSWSTGAATLLSHRFFDVPGRGLDTFFEVFSRFQLEI